jgi:TetR/AcrR family transcriptional repressor of the ameABC operon
LAEAITVLHLDLIRAGIEAIPASAPAPKRLRLFAETLLASHLSNMEGSPYVFDLIVLSMESETEGTHAFHAWLVGALRAIVEAGMAEGCFAAGDPDRIARVLLVCIEGATHPLLIAHRDREGLSGRLGEVMAFLTASLRIAC